MKAIFATNIDKTYKVWNVSMCLCTGRFLFILSNSMYRFLFLNVACLTMHVFVSGMKKSLKINPKRNPAKSQ